MGLDISAFSQVEFIEVVPDSDVWEEKYDDNNGLVTEIITGLQDFPERLLPLFAPLEGFAVYRVYGEIHEFRVGSFTYYNEWRKQLSVLVTRMEPEEIWKRRKEPSIQQLPFYELIDFSDCEGSIGPAMAQKLAQDFMAHQLYIEQRTDADFQEVYADFRKAFTIASNNGIVTFH
ncbi:hypothetical protein SD80_012210 [Scytonema tolypothrichoides VB-61278]|nr:hypothetical protein SD80_012210 [Scytonema tolypothrichoides VB-61278]